MLLCSLCANWSPFCSWEAYCSPASGPLHRLVAQHGMMCLQVSSWTTPHLPSCLLSDAPSQNSLSRPPPLHLPAAATHDSTALSCSPYPVYLSHTLECMIHETWWWFFFFFNSLRNVFHTLSFFLNCCHWSILDLQYRVQFQVYSVGTCFVFADYIPL